ncbi:MULTISPECIES: hypothetical protein [unclassified Wolbachia]|uniref:hypothetical protein n=1 Tax=unclassified Wolbachia TaxID=2640676 RepID=UPI0021F85B8A|nr:hypothetical protein [Wolbachia endosymbiont (group B) of Erebia ligea]
MFRGNLQGFNSEEKGVDLQQKLDDFSSYSVIRDIMRICSNKCQNSSSLQECLQQCLQVLSFYSLELSEPRSQISEKLAAIVFPKVNDKGIIKYLSYNGI